MKPIIQRSSALAATLALVFVTFATSAPSAAASARQFIISGRVLKVDRGEGQMLIADRTSKKLYLINVPKEVRFKITFGKNMQARESSLADVDPGNRVEVRCARADKDHLSRLDDGREVIVLTAAH